MKHSSCARWCSSASCWRRRPRGAGKRDPRPQRHAQHREAARGVAAHDPERLVAVVIDAQAGLGREMQEPQHVAAGECGDQCFLGIDRRLDRHRHAHHVRRGGGRHLDAAVETPAVGAAVAVVGEQRRLRAPSESARGIRGRPCFSSVLRPADCTIALMPHSELQPRRDLTLTHATSLVVGITIGTGVFLKSAAMAQAVGTPALVLGAWVAAGLVALLGGAVLRGAGRDAAGMPGASTSTCAPPTARSRPSSTPATASCSGVRSIAAYGAAVAIFISDIHPFGARMVRAQRAPVRQRLHATPSAPVSSSRSG